MIDEEELQGEGLAFLEQQDKIYGKNQDVKAMPTEPAPVANSLGKATTPMVESTVSGSNDLFWKNIPLANLPSGGLFYPEDAEITIKAATVAEIRQW